jgi:hypothetical protein
VGEIRQAKRLNFEHDVLLFLEIQIGRLIALNISEPNLRNLRFLAKKLAPTCKKETSSRATTEGRLGEQLGVREKCV